MANFLLSCFANATAEPAGHLAADEAYNLPAPALLSRAFNAAPNLTDPGLRSQIAGALPRHPAPSPLAHVNDVLQAARNAMTLQKDQEILDMAQAFIAAVLSSPQHQGQSQGQSSNHQQPIPTPPMQQQQGGQGSYAGATGQNAHNQGKVVPAPSQGGGGGGGKGGNTWVKPYFFPSEDSFAKLRGSIESAEKTLDVCVFNITDDHLATALIQAKRRGVKVRIISDDTQSESKGSDVLRMGQEAGIPYVLDNNPSHMHNKFVICDGRLLVTGSYNWTKGARFENRENILLTNDASAISGYSKEFETLWRAFGGQQC